LPGSVLTVGLLFATSRSIGAQQPVPPPLPGYRPPELALVQPASDGSVPLDRPVIVFRFAPGDSTDPIDVRSLAIAVDGKDRVSSFQVARDMAWGPLAPPEELQSLLAGAHSVVARICSIRGACNELRATVTVAAPATPAKESAVVDRKRTLIDLLLAAARKLLNP
jgi:hypothetical protein